MRNYFIWILVAAILGVFGYTEYITYDGPLSPAIHVAKYILVTFSVAVMLSRTPAISNRAMMHVVAGGGVIISCLAEYGVLTSTAAAMSHIEASTNLALLILMVVFFVTTFMDKTPYPNRRGERGPTGPSSDSIGPTGNTGPTGPLHV